MYKNCFKCHATKPLTSFHKHKQMKDGRLNKCSACTVRDVARWRSGNPGCRSREHARVIKKNGRMTREEYFAKRKENAIGRRASSIKYAHKRRLRTQNVDNFTDFVVEECCALAVEREAVTGFKWHIDHIVPLFHDKASGLHVAANLQVVPGWWNFRKNNKSMEAFSLPLIAGY